MHQGTVDMYLEDVILGSINQTADAQAREEIHRKAEELNNITYAMEETYVSILECYPVKTSFKISQLNNVLMTMNHKLLSCFVISAGKK